MKDRKLKKTIQSAKLDSPSEGFSDRILSEVSILSGISTQSGIDASQQLNLPPDIARLVKREAAATVPDLLADKVMARLTANRQSMAQQSVAQQSVARRVHPPIIGPKAWIAVAAFITGIVLIAIGSSLSSPLSVGRAAGAHEPWWGKTASAANPSPAIAWIDASVQAISVYSHQWIGFLIVLVSLLWADFLWRRRWMAVA